MQESYNKLVAEMNADGRLPANFPGASGGGSGSGSGNGNNARSDTTLATPLLPDDVLQGAVPDVIKKAESFCVFMDKVVVHMRERLTKQTSLNAVESETPTNFTHQFAKATGQEVPVLKHCYSRLNNLMKTLEITNMDAFSPLQDVADFATLVATYDKGFAIVIEPNGSVIPGVYEPTAAPWIV